MYYRFVFFLCVCVDVLLIFALLLCFCIVQSPPSPPLLVGIPNPIILMSIAFNRVVFGLSTPGIKGIGYFYRALGISTGHWVFLQV